MKRISLVSASVTLALLTSAPAFAACNGLLCNSSGGGSASLPRANVGGKPTVAVMPRAGAVGSAGMPRTGGNLISQDGGSLVAQGAGNFGPGRR